jgi:aminoglycoside phosphotransferase (APT) family kinase protein
VPSHALPHTDVDFLRRFLRELLGGHAPVVRLETLKAADDYLVVRAHFDAPAADLTVKLAGPNAALATPFDQSAHVINLARDAGVPVPTVLATDVSASTWPWRYLICTWLDGHTWSSLRTRLQPSDWPRIYAQFGTAVGVLHTIPFADFGELAPSGLVQSDGTYRAALVARARRRLPLLSKPAYADLFEAVLEAYEDWFARPPAPCLTHDDLNHTNLILRQDADGWGLSGIVDFEAAWSGGPEPDLARLDFWRGMTDPNFWHAYRAARSVPEGWEQRRHLLRLLWCLEYAQATAEHLHDTAQVCAELGIAPIVFT